MEVPTSTKARSSWGQHRCVLMSRVVESLCPRSLTLCDCVCQCVCWSAPIQPLKCSASASDFDKWCSLQYPAELAAQIPSAYADLQQPVPKCATPAGTIVVLLWFHVWCQIFDSVACRCARKLLRTTTCEPCARRASQPSCARPARCYRHQVDVSALLNAFGVCR